MTSTPQEPNEYVKNLLKSEMKKVGFTYKNLVDALEERGIHETEANLRNKISRGGFSAAFFVEVLQALGCGFLVLDPFAVRPTGDLPAEPVRKSKVTVVREMPNFPHPRSRKE